MRFCPVDGTLVTAAVEDRNLGQVLLGQFEVRDVCGRGAMGTVYRAYQRTMDRVVAVKILRRELLKEPEVVRRFLREARAAAKLQHANIVTVHLVGETDDGVPFLVMEHIDGVALEAICEAQGAQPVARILSLTRQIANALAEAHDAGIVHRDLKPANILITDRSRVPDLVKVLDFGIAKIVSGADQSMLSRDGMIFGTPHYIAPEQATGADIDHRADLYSLGVILFRLATGRLPFEGTQGMQVVLKHLRELPPKPRTIDPTLPESLEELILSCLAKDRTHRPDDAEAVIAMLDRIAANPADAKATMHGVAPLSVRPAVTSQPHAMTLRPPDGAEVGGPTAADVARRVNVASRAAKPTVKVTPGRGVQPVTTTAKVRALRPDPGAPQTPEPPPPWWAGKSLLIGAGAAVLIGAGIGVGGALLQNRAAPIAAIPPPAASFAIPRPAPPPRPVVSEPPAATTLVLVDEHVLTEGAMTLRAGFERTPQVGGAAFDVILTDGAGAVSTARVDVNVTPPGGFDEHLPPMQPGPTPGRYRSDYTFKTAGRYKVRVVATEPGRREPIVLAFDVDAHAAEVRASGRRARPNEEPAVIDVTPPERARRLPPAAAEHPDDRPPPPPADPTTLPPPSPEETR